MRIIPAFFGPTGVGELGFELAVLLAILPRLEEGAGEP
jgi:hypothetical protein